MQERKILLVDDEPNVITALQRCLRGEDYDILTAEGAEQALAILEDHQIQIIITDENMPGMTGNEFLAIARKKYPLSIRMMLTGKASIASAMKAVNQGEIYRFFIKPWDTLELKLSIRHGIEKYDFEKERLRLLSTIKLQTDELSRLEEEHPGITALEEDENGTILLQQLSETEMRSVIEWCDKKGKEEQEGDQD